MTDDFYPFVKPDRAVETIYVLPEYKFTPSNHVLVFKGEEPPAGVMAWCRYRRVLFTHCCEARPSEWLLASLRESHRLVVKHLVVVFEDDPGQWKSFSTIGSDEADWVTNLQGVAERWRRTLHDRLVHANHEMLQASKRATQADLALQHLELLMEDSR